MIVLRICKAAEATVEVTACGFMEIQERERVGIIKCSEASFVESLVLDWKWLETEGQIILVGSILIGNYRNKLS